MKYIRTIDGEILIAPELYDNGGVVLMSSPPQYETRNAKNEWGCVCCHDVIKQADTIGELCDEFVYVGEKGNVVLGMSYLQIEDVKKYNVNDNKIYGAIWTDKGLIYVAKMKGVLPNGEIDWELL